MLAVSGRNEHMVLAWRAQIRLIKVKVESLGRGKGKREGGGGGLCVRFHPRARRLSLLGVATVWT